MRQLLSQFLATPADARRAGIEFVLPDDPENPERPTPEGVADLVAERRKRLLSD